MKLDKRSPALVFPRPSFRTICCRTFSPVRAIPDPSPSAIDFAPKIAARTAGTTAPPPKPRMVLITLPIPPPSVKKDLMVSKKPPFSSSSSASFSSLDSTCPPLLLFCCEAKVASTSVSDFEASMARSYVSFGSREVSASLSTSIYFRFHSRSLAAAAFFKSRALLAILPNGDLGFAVSIPMDASPSEPFSEVPSVVGSELPVAPGAFSGPLPVSVLVPGALSSSSVRRTESRLIPRMYTGIALDLPAPNLRAMPLTTSTTGKSSMMPARSLMPIGTGSLIESR